MMTLLAKGCGERLLPEAWRRPMPLLLLYPPDMVCLARLEKYELFPIKEPQAMAAVREQAGLPLCSSPLARPRATSLGTFAVLVPARARAELRQLAAVEAAPEAVVRRVALATEDTSLLLLLRLPMGLWEALEEPATQLEQVAQDPLALLGPMEPTVAEAAVVPVVAAAALGPPPAETAVRARKVGEGPTV